MVYNGVINFNEKAKMDVVDFVNNQNPVSKKINDTNINRLNNYYNNNLQHNRKKKPLNLRDLFHVNTVTLDASHFSSKNGGELIIQETGFLSDFFQRQLQGICNYFKSQGNKYKYYKMF